MPTSYNLGVPYPNPFNPITNISYELPEDSFVTLSVYDVNGKLLKEIESMDKAAGYYSVQWDATNQSSGLYFIAINAGSYSQTRKVMLVK